MHESKLKHLFSNLKEIANILPIFPKNSRIAPVVLANKKRPPMGRPPEKIYFLNITSCLACLRRERENVAFHLQLLQ